MDLTVIREQLGVIVTALNVIRVELLDVPVPPEPEPEPPPPPPPSPVVETATYKVTGDKAIAYFVHGENANGYPIMQMIPVEERAGQPFKNLTGQIVKVVRARVNADGPVDFFEISGVLRVGTKEKLYLSNADGKLID